MLLIVDCAPNSKEYNMKYDHVVLRDRRKRAGCCRRLESTRINHEIASCFNTGCE